MLNFLPRPGQPILGEITENKYKPEELTFLDPAAVQLRRNEYRLQCRLGPDEWWQDVTLVRLFPYSQPEEWISLQDKDGHEIGVLESLQGMSGEKRALLHEELSRRYLTPRIIRLLSRRQRFDVFEWTAETTLGKVKFLTRGLRDQMQQPLPGHFIFSDVEGNRYEIPNLVALDPTSRKLLEEQI